MSEISPEVLTEVTLAPREVALTTRTGTIVRRSIPHRNIRTIGAWCFVDHYGPTNDGMAMSIAAHPHTGLQTVSWLFSGTIEHRDSLGTVQLIQPGQLNLMTSGHGISHSELSISQGTIDPSHEMHGVQLWVVLPNHVRDQQPSFEHHSDLPVVRSSSIDAKVFMGEFLGARSTAQIYSELVGVELTLHPDSTVDVPLLATFEYGALLVSGDVSINGSQIPLTNLHYMPPGKTNFLAQSKGGAKILLIGGEPFQEEFVMWWNFIGRNHDEIEQMRLDWNNHSERFPGFVSSVAGVIPAPELPNLRLKPRPNKNSY